CVNGSCFTV
nr:Chain C, NA231 influenza epitope [unidentified influenza virus]